MSEYQLDDELEYHGYRVGRPTRTVEVAGADGAATIEEGTLTGELACEDEIRSAREEGGWVVHYVAPDGGVGFGIGEGNSGGVALHYDLEGIVEFPEPMAEGEADDWLIDEHLLQFKDESVESDTTAEDILEAIR